MLYILKPLTSPQRETVMITLINFENVAAKILGTSDVEDQAE